MRTQIESGRDARMLTEEILQHAKVLSPQEALAFAEKYFPDTEDESLLHQTRAVSLFSGEKNVLLTYGNKLLLFSILELEQMIEVSTMISSNSSMEKKDNDTTEIYRALAKYLQNLANVSQKPVEYILQTSHEKLILWAKGKGMQIFHWDSIYEPKEQDDELIAKKRFTPKIV
ncbi:MAG: hypothetical protein COV59_02315 [Candidatus Magasanikbacteria bacterium CG11_big_fil_rev_8_21_14_0_20_39_34]|uniref:Uncharacterized protein n=1 Tax=Candidatus Magasanikbacteria bacterium CG11_big_fil_rev_8_21_14_0_20_39_34 TaxID=1974653 RepID=A0A2H0N7A5_9BACT|nr:MAG: hypothetical protein COV59_02315 [Candidatus Magasanikbacteria bacterium CG11_big_fil_rev_8_21_14_0_20_39_34]